MSVGGPSDTRDIGGGLTVTKLAVGEMNNNAYLLRDGSGQGLLIDAAAEPGRLVELIGASRIAVFALAGAGLTAGAVAIAFGAGLSHGYWLPIATIVAMKPA